MSTLSLTSTVVRSTDQVSTDWAARAVITGLQSGEYFSLEGVGLRIWEPLGNPHRRRPPGRHPGTPMKSAVCGAWIRGCAGSVEESPKAWSRSVKRLAHFLTLPAARRSALQRPGDAAPPAHGAVAAPAPSAGPVAARAVAKPFEAGPPPPPTPHRLGPCGPPAAFVPGGDLCLLQSLAGRHLLTRRGYLSHLRIGVAKESDGPLRAHAWVEWDGRILIGGVGPTHFTPFPPLEVRHP